ncbi:transposase, partial [Paraburkholderia sp.]|uniref:transposase n=1 Tax=Paraburkholderia sp. TaxID=1926495 RepID=UPI003C7E5620
RYAAPAFTAKQSGSDNYPAVTSFREATRGIKPVIAKRRTEHGSGLGTFRWVVERTHSWLHNFRRLRIRFDRRANIHEAFLKLGCALVCWNIFRRTEQHLERRQERVDKNVTL